MNNKSVTIADIKTLAYETGNSVEAVLTELISAGYEIQEHAPTQPQGKPMQNSKDAVSAWKQLGQSVPQQMYNSDPIIRQLMDSEKSGRWMPKQESVLVRDEQGRVTGTRKSMLAGATIKEQAELMRAIREEYN